MGTVSAVSNTGERLYHTGKIYIASGIRDCYISCDAMRDLRIINEHFPLPIRRPAAVRPVRGRRQDGRPSVRLPASDWPAPHASLPAIQRH